MRYEDPNDIKEKFGELNTQQLWALVKFAKHIRLRCRSNSALNNYLNRLFPYATFKEVTKVARNGDKYQGLSINNNSEDEE
jgi:hypothetical protein